MNHHEKIYEKGKKIVFWTGTLIVPFVFLFVVGEVAFRCYHFIKPLPTRSGSIILDDRLGWRAAPNYTFHNEMKDSGGIPYEVNLSTNQDGFRAFGNVNTSRKKILFLGDSFTHAQQISDEKTYYGILQQQGIGEIFAYGTSGYGTLQESMILEQYLDQIRPNVIVLQFCSNDFINNSYALELQSSWNNSGKRRPYLTVQGNLMYAVPKTHFVQIRDLMMSYSQLLNSLLWRIDQLYAATHKKTTIEHVIESTNGELEAFHDAVRITEHIFRKIRKQVVPSIPIYVFETDSLSPYRDALKRIVPDNGMVFLEGIPEAIHYVQQQGIITTAQDNIHWNETGHAIVAKELMPHLR